MQALIGPPWVTLFPLLEWIQQICTLSTPTLPCGRWNHPCVKWTQCPSTHWRTVTQRFLQSAYTGGTTRPTTSGTRRVNSSLHRYHVYVLSGRWWVLFGHGQFSNVKWNWRKWHLWLIELIVDWNLTSFVWVFVLYFISRLDGFYILVPSKVRSGWAPRCDSDDAGDGVLLYNSFMHTKGTAPAAELQQEWQHYFSLLDKQDVKQCTTVVRPDRFACFMI